MFILKELRLDQPEVAFVGSNPEDYLDFDGIIGGVNKQNFYIKVEGYEIEPQSNPFDFHGCIAVVDLRKIDLAFSEETKPKFHTMFLHHGLTEEANQGVFPQDKIVVQNCWGNEKKYF